jgi:hypothetical protein
VECWVSKLVKSWYCFVGKTVFYLLFLNCYPLEGMTLKLFFPLYLFVLDRDMDMVESSDL